MGLRAGVVLAGMLGLLPVGGVAAWITAVVALVLLVAALVTMEVVEALRARR